MTLHLVAPHRQCERCGAHELFRFTPLRPAASGMVLLCLRCSSLNVVPPRRHGSAPERWVGRVA